jgi:hypothetical protein
MRNIAAWVDMSREPSAAGKSANRMNPFPMATMRVQTAEQRDLVLDDAATPAPNLGGVGHVDVVDRPLFQLEVDLDLSGMRTSPVGHSMQTNSSQEKVPSVEV